jgi:hypothetical protein
LGYSSAVAADNTVSGKVANPPVSPLPAFIPPEGTQLVPHIVQRNESLGGIVSHYLPESVYMRRSELEDALRQANGLTSARLKPGMEIKIPGIPLKPILDKPVPPPKDFVAEGIYLTAYTAGSSSGLDLMKRWKGAGGNTVVFDIKDYDGIVHVPFPHVYSQTDQITVRNLPKLIHYIHTLQMHVVVRIAVFRDERLVTAHPELAVRSRATGQPWRENGKLVWTDPSNPEVEQYNLDLANLAANAGADEVQFDYVRFPAEGDQADAQFAYQKDHADWPRSKVITDFVGRAHQMLHAQGVLFSIDVFGVMAWARPVDLSHTGQNIADLAHQVDVMSPMIYPSHFYGFDGYKLPGDAPEHFISESMQRFGQATKGTPVVLRPWLQAFGWRTSTYSPQYILIQVRVSHQQGGVGFMFWNARNDYSKPFDAMPKLPEALNAPLPPAEKAVTTEKAAGGEKAPPEAPVQGTKSLPPADKGSATNP